jgi:hypothetical protein
MVAVAMAKIQLVLWGALAASWLFANRLLVEFEIAAFQALSIIGVCTDATIEVCKVAILVLPASGLALTWFVVGLVLNRIAAIRGPFVRTSLPWVVFWSGLAFVAGAFASGVVERGGTWLPALFANAVVLVCAVTSLTRPPGPSASMRAPD